MAINGNLKSVGWKLPAFIGLLAALALLINYAFYTRAIKRNQAEAQAQREAAAAAEVKQAADEQAKRDMAIEARRIEEEAQAKAKAEKVRRQAEEEAVAEHTRFLARNLNPAPKREPGMSVIAVAVESETGTLDPTVSQALAKRLQTNDTRFLNSFFKPDFVADRCVENILSGDTAVFETLELTNWLNGVLLGRQSVTYSTNTTLENTVTANLRLEVMALPIGSTRESQSWNVSANGAGFNPFDARQQAEERLIHRIETDSTISLSNLGKTN